MGSCVFPLSLNAEVGTEKSTTSEKWLPKLETIF